MRRRIGGCNCGQVRFEAAGEPSRVGFCHCQTCRRESGSVGNFFAVWRSGEVVVTGETRSWRRTTYNRHSCPVCGSPVFGIEEGFDEIEIGVGALDDAPSGLAPSYELWTGRREKWFLPVAGAEQHAGNRKTPA